IWYTNTTCSGTVAYLNDGGAGNLNMWGKYAVWANTQGAFFTPTSPSNRYETPAAVSGLRSIDNPTCQASTGTRGWCGTKGLNNGVVGLPSGTRMALPLSIP